MEYWNCTICDIDMQMHTRDAHLSGKRHSAAAAAYQERLLQAARSPEALKRWTCTACNIEMAIQNRESHLSGSRHAKATQSQQEEVRTESRTYLPERRGVAASSSSMKGDGFATNASTGGITRDAVFAVSDLSRIHRLPEVLLWQCTMCDCSIPAHAKQLHLSSLDHVKNLLELIGLTCTALPQPRDQVFHNEFAEEERLDYQNVVSETMKLAAYLTKKTLYKQAPAGVSPISTPVKSTAQSNMNPKLETRACSLSPLDAFFLSFPGYQYDPSKPPAESFRSFQSDLKQWSDWDGSFPATWKDYRDDVYSRYQAALTNEFNLWFGTEDDLGSWHSLCRAIGISPPPPTCKKCREAVRKRHVNIVDLIEWAREQEVGRVQIFETVKELSDYSYEEGKIYRKEQIGQGAVLRHLLKHLDKMRSE